MNQEDDKQATADAAASAKPNGKDQGAPEQSETQVEQSEQADEVVAEDEAVADERLAVLEKQVQDYKDQLLRAVAETENVRKRSQRQLEDAHKYAISNFARDLLNVSDNLRRAIEASPAEQAAENELLKNLHAGVQAVERDLLAAFEKHGIAKITPLNDRFDPNFHQAMFEVPDSGKPPGTVVQLLQPGYVLHDRLLRPAMVGVAKGQPEEKKVDTTV